MRGREFKGTILCKVNFRVFGLLIIKGLVPSLVLQSVTERPTNKPSFTSLTRSTFQGLRCDGCGSTVPPQGSRNYLWLFSSIFFLYPQINNNYSEGSCCDGNKVAKTSSSTFPGIIKRERAESAGYL